MTRITDLHTIALRTTAPRITALHMAGLSMEAPLLWVDCTLTVIVAMDMGTRNIRSIGATAAAIAVARAPLAAAILIKVTMAKSTCVIWPESSGSLMADR